MTSLRYTGDQLIHAVADEIDEDVGEGDVPQQAVLEHIGEEDFLGGEVFLSGFFVVVFRVVVFPLLNRWQAAGLRGVFHNEVHRHGKHHGDDARIVEGLPPDIGFGRLDAMLLEEDPAG